MEKALAVAEAYNRMTAQGGRQTMDAHLADLQKEKQYQDLLNRSRQRGFYTPQSDNAFRQREIRDAWLKNYADWGGYQTKDQYLGSLQRERQYQDALNTQWARRAALIRENAEASRSHVNALNDTHLSAGQIANSYSRVQQEAQKLPGDVASKITADDSQFLGAVQRDTKAAADLPKAVKQSKPKIEADDSPIKATVASVLTAMKSLQRDITASKLSPQVDTQSIINQFKALQGQLKDLSKGNDGLVFQPEGLDEAKAKFADLQQYAARSFDEIEAKGKESGEGFAAGWASAKNTVIDALRGMAQGARDAADDGGNAFDRFAARAKGAFSGAGGGGGVVSFIGGIGDAIKGLAGGMEPAIVLITTGILAIVQLLPALSAGLGALVSVAATLPNFLAAAGGAFATFQSAISPVINALQAYMQLLNAQQQVQAGGLNVVMQQQSAYHGLADAQFSLTQAVVQGNNQQLTSAHAVTDAEYNLQQARFSAAQAAIVDAHNVAEAQYNLKQAYFSASMTQIQESMAVANAQHSLQDANFAVTQSQYQLNIAWQQARFQLQELELQVGAASLNLRGAQLNLEQAQQNYAQTMAQSTSTALERAQAAYQIQVAEESLKQVELQNTQNETQLANVRKYGMQQVFGVTQAQHALTDAQFAQVQAQKNLMVVQKEAANSQIVAAHQVADAVFSLRQAFVAQSEGAITSAHNVGDAIFAVQQAQFQQAQGTLQSQHQIKDSQFSVQQAMEQLKLDAQAGGAAAVSAYNSLQVALSQLSPAAKKAVTDLEPIFLWWNNNTKAQQAFFGVFDKSLERLGKQDVGLVRPLNDMLIAIAHVLGVIGGKFVDWLAKLANSPVWKIFTNTSVQILGNFGNAALVLAEAFAKIAAAAAPLATWISREILNFALSFLKWANAEIKPGSMLHVLMNEAKPALIAVGQLLKSIVDFFEILAGGTPAYNKQGVLTGVIPTDSQSSAFRTFLLLLSALANTILPKLAQILNLIARPELANAVINLLDAIANVLVNLLASPAFVTAFTLFVNTFALLINLLSHLAGLPIVGQILGVAAAALVTIAGLKFLGVFALIDKFGKLAGYVKGIMGAEGFLGKLAAVFGIGGGKATGLKTAGDEAAATIKEAMVAGGEEAAAAIKDAMVTGGKTAGGEEAAGEAAGGKVAGGEEAAGEAAGGVTAGGKVAAVGGLLGRTAGVALGLAAAYYITKTIGGLIPKPPANAQTQRDLQNTPSFFQTAGKDLGLTNAAAWIDQYFSHPGRAIFDQYFSDQAFTRYGKDLWGALFGSSSSTPARRTAASAPMSYGKFGIGGRSLPPGTNLAHGVQAGSNQLGGAASATSVLRAFQQEGMEWTRYVAAPIQAFFAREFPAWVASARQRISGLWTAAHQSWFASVYGPVDTFFYRELPSWVAGGSRIVQGLWDAAHQSWYNNVWGPVSHFFTAELPGWQTMAGNGFKALWDGAHQSWYYDIYGPASAFFTQEAPGWMTVLGQDWNRMWAGAWDYFTSYVIEPATRFFSATVPQLFTTTGQDFIRLVATPLSSFFTKTFPATMEDAFKNSTNWVITNVINKTITFINDVVGKVSGVPQIKLVQTLASGGSAQAMLGSVAGANGVDKVDARLTAGEWVLREPARRAIDRHFGAGFLPGFLNQADRHLGYASGGEVASYAENFVGKVPYVWGGTSPSTGWDCSGMVYDIYRHFGWNPPRTSFDQWHWVSHTKAPEVGGLAFGAGSDGTAANPGHVGIIVAPNRMVDAYGTGYGTRFDAISGSMGPVSGFGVPPGAAGKGVTGFGPGTYSGFGPSAVGQFAKVFGGLGSYVSNIAKQADSALKGGNATFSSLWSHTIAPLEAQIGLTGTSMGGGVTNLSAREMASLLGLGNHLASLASSMAVPGNGTGGGGPTTADAAAAQQYARARLGAYGWGLSQWPPLDSLWNGESGWNRYAMNPSSHAFGIPQALPWTKMPKAAWPVSAGGQAAAGSQINWGMGYIKGVYGDPAHAYSLWLSRSPHWYASGGPVDFLPNGEVDPNYGHAMVPWWEDVQFPAEKPSPALAGGGEIGPVPFSQLAALVAKDWTGEQSAYTPLSKIKVSGHSKASGRITRRIAAAVKRQAAISAAFSGMLSGLQAGNPASLSGDEWTALLGATGTFLGDLTGSQSGWKDLRTQDAKVTKPLISALQSLFNDEKAAYSVWQGVAPSPSPGPVGAPPPAATPFVPSIYNLIRGGLGTAAFASGGPVDLSGLLGFPSAPSWAPPGLPSLAGFGMRPEPSRQLSEAGQAAAGNAAKVVNIGGITVNNPLRERASDSVTRNVQRAAFLAGRGVV